MANDSSSTSLHQRAHKAAGAQRLDDGTSTAQDDSNDSDADSEFEDDDWEWIYEKPGTSKGHSNESDEDSGEDATSNSAYSKWRRCAIATNGQAKRIIGARSGDTEFRIGDAVLVNCGEPTPWVALIWSFDQFVGGQMKLKILWLSSHTDVVNKKKKRTDFFANERYLTPLEDSISIATVDGKATLMSEKLFNQTYPKGISKMSKDHGKIFICRRGCEARAAIYTEEFVWEDIKPSSSEEVEVLHQRMKVETGSSKKKRASKRTSQDENFVDDDVDHQQVATPRKRQKYTVSTPRKVRTPSKLVTPSHRRVIIKKPLEFTPLGTRVLDPEHVASSPFHAARSRLHVSSVPVSLPCREDEFGAVYGHLEAAIIEGTGACIYISGTPGTGKTATVREVVAQLDASVLRDELDPFIFVEINGMKITDPHQSYSLLWQALKGDRVSPTHALDLLDREFSHPSPRRTPCVVLMDELDQLVTKNQSVMYNFFNWPGLQHSRLIVLAVANTMDLPERTLSNKISSRLGLTRITFPGYTHEQLMKIIISRLDGVPGHVVESDAIQFASRKVAAVSGDARRALDICRRAVELAENDALANPNPTPSKTPGRTKVGYATIATIRRAIDEATSSPLRTYLQGLPLAAKVLLVALVVRMRRTGLAESLLGDVFDEARRIAKMSTVNHDNVLQFLLGARDARLGSTMAGRSARVLAMGTAAVDLMEAGIVGLEARRADRTGKIRLCVGDEVVKSALKDDPEVKNLGF